MILRILTLGERFALALLSLWAAAALWFDGPASRLQAGAALAGLLLLTLFLSVRTRGLRRFIAWLPALVVAFWWLGLPPSNTRDWTPDVAQLSHVKRQGDVLTITNVRNFTYGKIDSDFTPHWETRRYDLAKLKGVNLFISNWGPKMIAHTILSWEFEDAPPLAISIETRKERGEEYSIVLGFFRHFELYYVVADERDVIGVRTNLRGEQVHLYPMKLPLAHARALLLTYVDSINELSEDPAWYNALSTNCTTTILQNGWHLAPVQHPLDWRFLANGYLDERMYEIGSIDTSMPLDALRVASDITVKARATGPSVDFSQRIRVGVPSVFAASAQTNGTPQ